MKKYFGYMPNDTINGVGICVSFWVGGCPFHCEGCHNPEAWSFNSGYEIPKDIDNRIIQAISANGIQRNFSILGGEPLCPENADLVAHLIKKIREVYPSIKIFVWTGYTLEELKARQNEYLEYILNNINFLIDGRFILEERDLTLWLRGSRNQNIYMLTKEKKYVKIKEKKDIQKYE